MSAASEKEISFTVPGTPPSVNHYKMRDRRGHWYVSAEAKEFKTSLWLAAKHLRIRSASYGLAIEMFLAANQRLDIDNGLKVLHDALVDAMVIDSDAKIKHLEIWLSRDRENPRTEITITALGGEQRRMTKDTEEDGNAETGPASEEAAAPARAIKATPMKARAFTEIAEHFTKATKAIDWPVGEPDVE